MLANAAQPKQCPYCKSTDLEPIDSKFFVTTLFKCKHCNLNHRHPKDTSKWLDNFYQQEYEIDTAMMTDLPSDAEIAKLKSENFNSLRDYSVYIDPVFNDSSIKVIDYGCSWGYNVFKLKNAGYDAVGFEVSRPRAKFGEDKLDVTIFSNFDHAPSNMDLFFSSHVIEHLIDLPKFIQESKSHLTSDGIFMAFCPNGNLEYRQREPNIWHGSWGDIHVNLIDEAFAKHIFKDHPYLILTGDWSFDPKEIEAWDGMSQKIGEKKDGKELLIISKPNIKI
ncbi:MAG: class I SAM-dependent methyltransferase [Flammeovirgaceae bacterium]